MCKKPDVDDLARILSQHMENFFRATSIMGKLAEGCGKLAERVDALEKKVKDLEKKQKDNGDKFAEM